MTTDNITENENMENAKNTNGINSLFMRFAGWVIKAILLVVAGYLTVTSMFTTVRLAYSEFLCFTGDNPLWHILAIALVILASAAVIFAIQSKTHNSSQSLCNSQSLNDNQSMKNPGISFDKVSKITSRAFYVVYILFIIILSYIVISGKLVPKFDAHRVSRAAVMMLQGDYSTFLKGGYARTCDNQYGLILFLTGFYKIFGRNNYVATEMINVISYGALVWLIRALFARFVKKENSWIADIIGIALCLFIPMWGYVTFIYGTGPYLALSTGAMVLEYDYFNGISKRESHAHTLKIIFAALLIGLATVLKTNAVIYMLAMLAYGLVKTVKTIKIENALKPEYSVEDKVNGLPEEVRRIISCFVGLVVIILAYVVISKALLFTMKNITGMDNLAGAPRTAHMAMGLQESSNKSSGWFNGYAHEVFERNDYDHDAANAEAVERIKESIAEFAADPAHAVGFFMKKTVSQWCEPTYECLFINMIRPTQSKGVAWWLNLATENGYGNDILRGWLNIVQTLIYFGCLAYCVMAFIRHDEESFDELFPAIVVLGGVMFHMIWEANSQYTFVYVIWMIAYACLGYVRVSEMLVEALCKNSKSENQTPVTEVSTAGRKTFIWPAVALAAFSLIMIVTAIAPDESFIGRSFKMNWDNEKYAQILEENRAIADGMWLNTVAEPTENYLEKTDAVFLGDVFRKNSINPENIKIKNGRYVIRPLADPDRALVIEDASMDTGAKAIIAALDDNRMIIWQVKDGYTIRCQNSQLVLDVEMASREPGTRLQQWDYNGDVSQIFDIVDAGDGTVAILYDNDMALTADGDGSVVIDEYQGNDSQKWRIQKK